MTPSVPLALQSAAARRGESHLAFGFTGSIMRAEAEQLAESIKQSVGLLRRHL
jgi:hypothetical protein